MPLPAKKMDRPDQSPYQSDAPQYDLFVFFQVPQKELQELAEKVSSGTHNQCPDRGADRVEKEELPRGNGAHADRKGDDRSKSIKEAEEEDQGSLKPGHQTLDFLQPRLQIGSPDHFLPIPPAQMEVQLVSEKSPEEGTQDH